MTDTVSIALPSAVQVGRDTGVPVVDVVVPVYNEQAALQSSVRRLHQHLQDSFTFPVRITIADNASTDDTPRIAADLAAELPGVRVVRLDEKGRGRALHHVWSLSDAPVLAYMDVDLSTDLAAFAPLIASLISGHSDLAIGTRLNRSSRVVRGAKREIISRCYNLILKSTLRAHFSDAQCGFKAIRADVARQLLPHVRDTGWFFDTELLVLAERSGLRIHEVPVDWVDDPDSRVDIVATAKADLLGIGRLLRGFAGGSIPINSLAAQLGSRRAAAPGSLLRQTVRFAGIGVLSTVAYLVLFLVLHPLLGAQLANFAALLITAIGNTAANRRFTFGVRGSKAVARHHVEGLIVFAVALAITSGSLAGLHAIAEHPGKVLETTVLVAANLIATAARFVLLRGWVFHPRR
ncbi:MULTISPECIES: bifunctional glycosyltransferase family 2/GtrA family protein [Mycobacteriaceae]|uniref:dolichyl-phosphate beta-glucosyltransferase n=1 Tax=Mycolicibacterium neoaurum VKM Ac-1815D TaxID=700508 RepID=V5XFG3_MYCNE|nr:MULTISPECIES: bifunctional glycosyltransferase family 2/GtrA family protein [Mycobacteriaceae]AHC26762.1 sugar translocase [Mycolicibacterium neoaurum VKM Ac-1815D]AMO07070.1 sugar translocase [Mycolicibacterium neoaurum]AXK74557.1 glycosyltransferase [Mycolicibacterium neoaurum]KJQ50210.1 sugar translocase [Mycolicibacterium neoaurum]KUM06818.1 sugar translocase [Mycolicibacterium neoaurum]